MADDEAIERRQDDRLDLIKRLFAVAISIGVGASLVRAKWVQDATIPSGKQVEQIFIVLLALSATVLSWDGYLASVHRKPLRDFPRFAIDVGLVFIYMFLLVTSDKSWFWLPIICVIYVLYVCWDALSVVQFPASFDARFEQEGGSRLVTVIRVYHLAMVDRAGIDRGPLISLMWACYFFAMWALIWRFYPGYAVIPAVLFAGLGLAGYRIDKQRKRGDVRGFTMIERTLIIILLVACVTLYGCLTGGSQTA
jgi:hypothetical protein